jgi:hypothetical protein
VLHHCFASRVALQYCGAHVVGVERFNNACTSDAGDVTKENKKERDFRKSGLDKKYEEFDGEAYVGRTIRKKFEDGLTYEGTVASYDRKARGDPQKGYRWLVRYLDGDEETMSLEELRRWGV